MNIEATIKHKKTIIKERSFMDPREYAQRDP